MVKKNLIVDIIPLINLPSKNPDFFSYFTRKNIKKNSIVQVEFGKKKIFGYVFRISSIAEKRIFLKEEKINLKPILKIINQKPIIYNYQINLAHFLKNYANLSLASALKLFFPYKKLFYLKNNFEKEKIGKKFQIKFKEELEISDFKNKKTLIIVPQDNYLDFLKEKFQIENIISSKISEKKFFELIKKIISNNKEIFLGTKNSIFLPWNFLDQIIIYQEGSIFYKEFFKEPYFDYRKIFLKFAELNKIDYLAIDTFPSFSLIKKLNLKPEIKIDFQRISDLNEFENELKNFQKTIIFFPQKSFGQKLICHHCHYLLRCPICNQYLIFDENILYCPYCQKKQELVKICPNCQKEAEFSPLQIGASAIYQYLLKIKRNALFLEKDDKKIINYFKNNNADLIGSLFLLNPDLQAQSFFFFNFSQFYFSSDIFLKEKFLRILEFFSKRVEKIYLVSEIINPQIEEKIKNGGVLDEILKEREVFQLPPFKRLVILKEGSSNLEKLQEKMTNIRKELEKRNLKVVGPIFSKPFRVKKRFFLEIILKLDPKLDFNLKKLLEGIEVEKIDIDALGL